MSRNVFEQGGIKTLWQIICEYVYDEPNYDSEDNDEQEENKQ